MPLKKLNWQRSTHSGENGGDCVELADVSGAIAVRDSKDRDGPVLLLTRAALLTAVRVAASATA